MEKNIFEVFPINEESEESLNFDAKESCFFDIPLPCIFDFCSPTGCDDTCGIDFTG